MCTHKKTTIKKKQKIVGTFLMSIISVRSIEVN